MKRLEINVAPEYQRGAVWAKTRQALLIDSMIRGYDLPKIFVRKIQDGPDEIVDGQQRLNAIAAFFDNDFSLPVESGKYAKKYFKDLPSWLQDKLEEYQLHLSMISNADDEEIREMFLRLQMGVRLNAAEELNAVDGAMHQFVLRLTDLPIFQSKVSFSSDRGAHRHVAAQLTRLAVQGLGDCRKKDLLLLYKTHKLWVPNNQAKKLKRVLEWAVNVFDDKDALLRNRGLAVSTIWSVYALWDDLDFSGQESVIRHALKNFDAATLTDDPAYESYRSALSHSSDGKRSIELRHHFMLAAIARGAASIPRIDPQRNFSSTERAAIYYRDGGKCQFEGCNISVNWSEFHADHVIPWIHGGTTSLANAQCLCKKHNLQKGAKVV